MLFPARRRGHVGIVKALLEKGANVNYINRGEETPLLAACQKSHLGVIKVLLNGGADLSYANHGETALTIAVKMSRCVLESRCVVRYLLENTSADMCFSNPPFLHNRAYHTSYVA